jgi:hypothetical protein
MEPHAQETIHLIHPVHGFRCCTAWGFEHRHPVSIRRLQPQYPVHLVQLIY